MNFKPTKWKVIVSVIIMVIWILSANWMNSKTLCDCYFVPECGPDYEKYMIVKPRCVGCGCQSFSNMLSSNFLNILIPFAIVYIVWSLFEKKK